MKRMLLSVTCAAFLVACANAKPSTPAIWRVCDQDNCLYLLGSFHALQASDYPLSQAVQDAYKDAELLAFEVSPEQMLSPDLARQMQQAGFLPASEKLQQHVPEKTWQLVLKWIDENPTYPLDTVQKLKPWYLALIITNTQAQAQGFKSEQGVDQHFMNQAEGNKKPSIGLEQAHEQISLFDDMSLATQIQLLDETLQPMDQQNNELDQLHAYWKVGNVPEMERIVVQKMQHEYPDLYQSINVARNDAWVPQLQNLLDKNSEQDVLVIVGALHLIGPDGVVKKLQSKGYKVERL
jgi:uncharacterized protein YbaP (TraB family)